jgi:uroporphyrinogen decarboxylase
MTKLCRVLVDYLQMQIKSGADAVQIFDSWGALCTDEEYERFSLNWIKSIIAQLPANFPVIVYTKGMSHQASALASTGAKVLSLDWTCRLSEIRKTVGPLVALQGNLDPALLNTTPDVVCAETQKILRDMSGKPGHIFNLGHGIMPEAKIENVEALVETVCRWPDVQ